MDEQKSRAWAVISHLGGLIAYASFLGILIPLAIWLIKGESSEFINQQAKEACNFQISCTVYNVIGWIIFLTVIGIPIAFIWWFMIWAMNIFCSIKGAIWTGKGNTYRYPLNLRLIP